MMLQDRLMGIETSAGFREAVLHLGSSGVDVNHDNVPVPFHRPIVFFGSHEYDIDI